MQVGAFFADFLCRERKLVVELDGFAHVGRTDYDAARDRWFASQGYRVLRFANAEVLHDAHAVAARIAEEAARLARR